MTDPDWDSGIGLVEGKRIAREIESISPALAAEVAEHRETHGEILSTLLLDRLADWWVEARQEAVTSPRETEGLERVLVALWNSGDDIVQNAIATGFLEALPGPDRADRQVVESLPPVLREELRKMEDWRPSDAS